MKDADKKSILNAYDLSQIFAVSRMPSKELLQAINEVKAERFVLKWKDLTYKYHKTNEI
ncbi:hypothetical protein [Campylobacter hyointestinalis]|uniref:hypothetical protein n=1 Tax=Campylobacter hyointestinalis TaxID=198 RepID=UPI0015ECAB0B|nr:hypothetical protein [Campylobacter hyointestinalis]